MATPTLQAGLCHSHNTQNPLIIEHNPQDSRTKASGICPTLTAKIGTGGGNLPLVIRQHNHGEVRATADVPTLNAQSGGGRKPMLVHAVAIAENTINRQDHNGGHGVGALEETCYTLNSSGIHAVATRSCIRRLIPLECERLQSFPDEWTNIPKSCDTGRYKALGNAITVNVAEWIFKRLVRCEANSKAQS